MRLFICFVFIVCTCSAGVGQTLKKDSLPKWSINLETNITPINSINSTTQFCYQGQLGIEFRLIKNIQIGILGQTLLYTGNYEIANIDNKIIDLSSIEYNTLGITTGYKAKLNKIIIYPKLDIGYNFFDAKSLDFPTDKKDFLDYRYLSVTPKINLGFAISEHTTLGINLGYNKQVLAFKGITLEEFNPNSVICGVFCNFGIK